MANHVSIVVPTKFPDIYLQLAASLSQWESFPCRKIAVVDGAWSAGSAWVTVRGVEPFVFARNVNLGIAAAEDDDVLLVNDDVSWMHPRTIKRLQDVAADPSVGLVSPQFVGGVGNVLQMRGARISGTAISQERLAFVCVYIPRRTINAVGLLDERFTGYGGDDVDYCRRVQGAGLSLAVTGAVSMRHGFGGRKYSASFLRVMHPAEREASMKAMNGLVSAKWA